MIELTIPNMIVILVLTYFSNYIFGLLINFKKLKNVQNVNNKLDNLRTIPVKTLEEQKLFLSLKYPKSGKFKFSWIMIPKILFNIVVFVAFFSFYKFILSYFNLNFIMWQSILFMIIFPILFNVCMKKFSLQKDDLRVYFRGSNKKSKCEEK